MTHRLASTAAALLFAAALPAWAASSASSAASDSASTSVGSSSTSVEKSSQSSSGGDKVAAGDYKIIEIAAVQDRPDALRLKLQPLEGQAAEGEFFLYVPQETVARSQLAEGQLVSAKQRAYGMEFARGETQKAFFLVLKDEWYRELQTSVVRL